MKKSILLFIVSILTVNLSFATENNIPEGVKLGNPILSKYGTNITFYQNFDNEDCQPALAAGNPKAKIKQGVLNLKNGLFNKGLLVGKFFYESEKNLDFSSPGSMVIWISPWKWEKKQKEPYLYSFTAKTDTHHILVGRMGAQPKGKTNLLAYIYTPKGLPNIAIKSKGGSVEDKNWKPGQWHMLALTWTPERIGFSVDGNKLIYKTLNQPLGSITLKFSIGASRKEKGQLWLQDEFVILNCELNNNDLKELYDKTLENHKKVIE
jgi:hypothetical protein